MKHTSIGSLTAACLLVAASASSAADVAWLTNYPEAQEQGQREQKPLAVFVGSGRAGHAKLVQEGSFSNGVRKILADHYVCVYVDADRDENQRLLRALDITGDHGLVISDRTGQIQAFHHSGALAADELNRQLQHFADPNVPINTTVTNAPQRVSYYPPTPPAVNPYQQNVVPSFQPIFQNFGGFGGFGGGFGGGGGGGGC